MLSNTSDGDRDQERLAKKKRRKENLSLIQLQQIIIHLKSELSNYKAKVEEYEKDYSKKEIKTLKDTNKKLSENINDFRELIELSMQEKSTLETTILKLEEEIKSYKADLKNAKDKKEKEQQLRQELELYAEKNKRLQSEIDSLRKINLDYESTHKNLLHRLESLETELDNNLTDEEFDEILFNNFKLLEDRLSEVIHQLAPINKNIRSLQEFASQKSDIDTLVDSISRHFEQERVYKKEIEELKSTVAFQKGEDAEQKNKISQLNNTIDRLIANESKLLLEIESLNNTAILHEENENNYKQEIENLNQLITDLTNKEYDYLQKIDVLNDTVSELTLKESNLQQQLENSNKTIDALMSKENDYLNTINTLNETVAELSANKNDLNQEIENLIMVIADFTSKEKDHLNTIDTLNDTVAELISKESKLQQDIQSLDKSITDFTNKDIEDSQKIKTLEYQVKELTEKEKNSKRNIENLNPNRQKDHQEESVGAEKSNKNNKRSHFLIDQTDKNEGNNQIYSPSQQIINKSNLNRFSHEQNQQKAQTQKFFNQASNFLSRSPNSQGAFPASSVSQQFSAGLISTNKSTHCSETKLETGNINPLDMFNKSHPLYSGMSKTSIDPFKNFRK